MEQNFFVIQFAHNGDCFGSDHPLTVSTEAQAIEHASVVWNALSEYDRKRLDSFFLCEAPADEDGCCDLDRARIIKEFAR